LGVAQPLPVGQGRLVARSPQQEGLADIAGQLGHHLLGPEVDVRGENRIDARLAEQLGGGRGVPALQQEPLFIDRIDVDKVDPPGLEPALHQRLVFGRVLRGENEPARRREPQQHLSRAHPAPPESSLYRT
jgi:hypothetical protein